MDDDKSNGTSATQDVVRVNDGLADSAVRQSLLRTWLVDLGLAFGLLSRFRVPTFELQGASSLARAVWAFPIVGAVIGCVGAIGYELVLSLGLAPVVAVLVALSVMVLCSGALHEDGLADFFDGVGGGRDRAQCLEIMRDSRIGTYGVLALVFVVGLQVGLLWSLAAAPGGWSVGALVVSVAAAARAAMIVPMIALPAARDDGLGAQVASVPIVSAMVGFVIALGLAVCLVGVFGAVLVMSVSVAIGGLVSGLAWRYLGGQTGDVLGATACLAFTASLFALAVGVAARLSQGGI